MTSSRPSSCRQSIPAASACPVPKRCGSLRRAPDEEECVRSLRRPTDAHDPVCPCRVVIKIDSIIVECDPFSHIAGRLGMSRLPSLRVRPAGLFQELRQHRACRPAPALSNCPRYFSSRSSADLMYLSSLDLHKVALAAVHRLPPRAVHRQQLAPQQVELAA